LLFKGRSSNFLGADEAGEKTAKDIGQATVHVDTDGKVVALSGTVGSVADVRKAVSVASMNPHDAGKIQRRLVPRDRVELSTHGFSVRCSTS
jgi:hypothetical protein